MIFQMISQIKDEDKQDLSKAYLLYLKYQQNTSDSQLFH